MISIVTPEEIPVSLHHRPRTADAARLGVSMATVYLATFRRRPGERCPPYPVIIQFFQAADLLFEEMEFLGAMERGVCA